MKRNDYLTFPVNRPFDMDAFARGLSKMVGKGRPVIFLCIGTDCSTGDSLGPLIGHQLTFVDGQTIKVLGTLKSPVTALNICDVASGLKKADPSTCVIAIDAALGQEGCEGQITVSKKPLKPGLGVKKSLPEVGEISITGIIGSCNISSDLSGIRLSLVMEMAEKITAGIRTWCYGNY